jgi:hypothetical protein
MLAAVMARSVRHARPIALIVAGGLAAAGGSALARPPVQAGQRGQSEVYESVRLRYTAHRPSSRSGLTYAVRQRRAPAGTQPPPVRGVRFRFHPGTRFDTGATRRCTVAAAELSRRGPAACPPASVLGVGRAIIYIGTPEDVVARATAINVRNGLRVVLQTSMGTVLRVLSARIRGAVVDVTIPRVPLGPGREAALTSFRLDIRAAGTRRRPYLRTPRACPRSGRWRIVYDVAYDDPPGRQRPYDLTRCTR